MSANERVLEERRKFLKSAAVGLGVVSFSMLGFGPVLSSRYPRLRPPGALDEHDFLAACIKCGQCVQVCPVNALKPADLTDGFGVGVPMIVPREQACDFACDVGQCILACPTGALTYHRPPFLPSKQESLLPGAPVLLARKAEPDPTLNLTERMGTAVLKNPELCLARKGQGVHGPTRGGRTGAKHRITSIDRWKPQDLDDQKYDVEVCDLCVRECPIEGAISLEQVDGHSTPVVHEACIGCGVCEMVCAAESAAIVVIPRGVA